MCWVLESTLVAPSAGEGVGFLVSVNGVPTLGGAVTTRSVVQPNFSTVDSMMPGVRSGQCPLECYSLTITAGSIGGGIVEIAAVGQGHDGSTVALETVWFHNDSDGVDRRPSAAVVFADTEGGDDGNGGTGWGDAVQTLSRSIALAKVGNNVGGATINCRGDLVGNDGAGTLTLETGPYHWLTFVADSGATWRPGGSIVVQTPASGGFVRCRFLGFDMLGAGPSFYDAASDDLTNGDFWVEGGTWGSEFFDGGGVRARFGEDTNGHCIEFARHTTGQNKAKTYVTGVHRRGAGIVFTSHKLVYDCVTESFLAGNIYCSGPPFDRSIYHSLYFKDQKGVYNTVRGIGANKASGTAPLEQLECQRVDHDGTPNPAGVVMRILGPIGGSDFGTALADNVGSPKTRAGIWNWAANEAPNTYSADPGTGGHRTDGWDVLGGGVIGGRSYVDLDNPSGVEGMAPAGAWIETCQVTSGSFGSCQIWNEKFHSSFLSYQDGYLRTEGAIFRDIATSDIQIEANSHFPNSYSSPTITRLLIDNVRDAGQSVSNFIMGGVDYTDCLFRRMSEVVSTVGGDAGHTWTGTSFVNCVFNASASAMADQISNGMVVDYCHFITGSAPAGATNCTTGSWLKVSGSSGVSPWSFEPADARKGHGSPLMQNLSGWAWDPSRSTMGCTTNVGLLDWTLPSDTVFASGSSQLSMDGTGSIVLGARADGSSSVSMTTAGGLEAGIVASSATAISLSTAGALVIQAPPTTVQESSVATDFGPSLAAGSWSMDVTPSDTVDLPFPANGFRSDHGSIVVVGIDGLPVTFVVPRGVRVIPLRIRRVNATSTDAQGITAHF